MTRVYVVDTSYLLELFAVPNFSTEPAIGAVRHKFEQAIASRAQLIVPLGCVFELADHIADVPNIDFRHKLAEKLAQTVKSSLTTSQPWQITPPDKLDARLPEIFDKYASTYLRQGMGLTDTYTLEEALRLKRKYPASLGYRVHIWTKDRVLKANEPDTETDAFVGS
jgi:hypothetical protein